MVKRRSTLKLGLTGVLGTLLPAFSLASVHSKAESLKVRVIYNSKYDESRRLAESLNSSHIKVTDIKNDLAGLWYKDLRTQLGQGEGIMFGLTDRLDLFCLEELARDLGMKTCFRVDHSIDNNGQINHIPANPADFSDISRSLGQQRGFGAQAFSLASMALQQTDTDNNAYKKSGPVVENNNTTLVSWMIS